MSTVEFATETLTGNPIEKLEYLAARRDWLHDRLSAHELAIECTGRWCDYRLFIVWRQRVEALHATCALDMRVPGAKRAPVLELLAQINERLPFGHFDLPSEDPLPLFRGSLLLRGVEGVTSEQLEDLVDIGLAECERFYPAFQFLIWGGKAPSEALAASTFEAVGEA